MTNTTKKIVEREDVVVKFVGDSGDGMQLIGTLFSDAMATAGNDLATFPDFPAEIRAPHNTIAGVSGFQVHFGHTKVYNPGDLCDVLVAMNPASLKANLKWAKKGATIIVEVDAFDEKSIEKAGYVSNPLSDNSLDGYNLLLVPMSTLSREGLKAFNVENKTADKSRNMVALGVVFNLFNSNLDSTFAYLTQKFKKKPHLIDINKAVLQIGYNYGETMEAVESKMSVPKAELPKGKYRNITGNIATAWGFLAAAERSGRPLFLGSYPITPATEILMELSKHKSLGAKVFQAEDEIAGICSAIGASYTGSLAITTTSGPGLSLKSEAMGLAVITELPIVVVDVQRGGPSTGLPTKSQQSDLLQVLFGRNGEAPMMVISASTPADCFYYAYMASKYAMEHMTPVVLLTEGVLGFGSELLRIPKVADLPAINPPLAKANDPEYQPYRRDAETLARQWAIPGTEGLRHRIGGLEKLDGPGTISTDPINHEKMVAYRAEKVERIANSIADQEVFGEKNADVLVITWGSTFGASRQAIEQLLAEGKSIAHCQIHYIMPFPKNIEQVLGSYKKIIVCELNSGQLLGFLRMKFPQFKYQQYNKIQGLPFSVNELVDKFNQLLEEK